jgi:toxin YoeB
MTFEIKLSRQAAKDWEQIQSLADAHALKRHAEHLHSILSRNPWQNPPPFKKLTRELQDCYARRLNEKHRFVYQVHKKEQVVFVLAMLGHYNDN